MKDKRVEVLKVLIERNEEELNISRLSKLSGIDYKNAYNILKKTGCGGSGPSGKIR